MPVKDTAVYLPDCLDSIIQQSFEDWELIAVNDHSMDESKEILKAYQKLDKRIRWIDNNGKGIIDALNNGYSESKGEIICRMDSDDIMDASKLQLLSEVLSKHGRGHIVSCGTKYFVDGAQLGGGFQRYAEWINSIVQTNSYRKEVYKECVVPSCCWMIYRPDFDAIGAFNSIEYPEDYDLCFRFYQSGMTIIGINLPLHLWRDWPNRTSRTSEVYRDNRFFHLKLRYFLSIDRNIERPLILWGAGKNGKDLSKMMMAQNIAFRWVCDNASKIGHVIYGKTLESTTTVLEIDNPQIIIAISSEEDQADVLEWLVKAGKESASDFWFFL